VAPTWLVQVHNGPRYIGRLERDGGTARFSRLPFGMSDGVDNASLIRAGHARDPAK
jgi:hypothetical protein